MDRAMSLRGMILKSLCGRTAARSLWDNWAIRLNHTRSFSVVTQQKLLDLISLIRKNEVSKNELQRANNKDVISLLDIVEAMLDVKGCRHKRHKKRVALSQKSKEMKKACHHEATKRQTESEGGYDLRFELWKERKVASETAARILRSPFLSENLLFETAVDRSNAADLISEMKNRKHLQKLQNCLKKELSIKFYSDYRVILEDPKVVKFRKVLTADEIDRHVVYHIYQLTTMELLRREKDLMIFLVKDFDHSKWSSSWLFFQSEKVIEHVSRVCPSDKLDNNRLNRGIFLHFTRMPFEQLWEPLPRALKTEMVLDIMKKYLSITAKIPKLLPRLSSDEMLNGIILLAPLRTRLPSFLESREIMNA